MDDSTGTRAHIERHTQNHSSSTLVYPADLNASHPTAATSLPAYGAFKSANKRRPDFGEDFDLAANPHLIVPDFGEDLDLMANPVLTMRRS